MNSPQPGFYQRRLVRKGPFCPIHIWIIEEKDPATGELMSDVQIGCSVDGREDDVEKHWTYCCDAPISEAQFDYLTSLSAYAKRHDPREPLAKPRKSIDPLKFRLPVLKQPAKRKAK